MYPFRDGDTHAAFRAHIEKIISEIKSLENEYVLNASSTELEQHYIEKALIEPLILYSDKYYIRDNRSTDVDVSRDFRRAGFGERRINVRGTRLDIAIPFEGDPGLWHLRASTWDTGGSPDIEILDNEIVFNIQFADDSANGEQIKKNIERTIKEISEKVEYIMRDVKNHNTQVPRKIHEALERKIESAKTAMGAIEALGIPIRKSDSEPMFVIPVKPNKLTVELPTVPKGDYKPEWYLDEEIYLQILEIMHHMSLVIERNPTSFASLDEEAIRDHFLIQLNGIFLGEATGETFNASGKTDILIRKEDKNVFIAECKFWRGPKAFNDAIDQLLRYLTWRDSKCAILIFNKTQDSSSVAIKMHDTMKARQEHRKTVSYDPTGDSKYTLIKNTEPGREIHVTTQLYDVPERSD